MKQLSYKTAIALACLGAAQAATIEFKFDSDPADILTVARGGDNGTLSAMAGAWFPSNGSTLQTGVDPSVNGYFAITQTTPNETAHGMRSVVVFDDYDNGMVVGGFTFTADLRIGGGIGSPADGFSLSFARSTDPVVLNPSGGRFGDAPNAAAVNVPEEGTTTGLVLSFDAFLNGTADTIGLTIKLDNVVVTNIPLTTLNGVCGNLNSIQTGPVGTAALGRDGSLAQLCWQPLFVQLTVDGRLSVAYKNNTLVTNMPVNYVPGPARLVLAGRTGGSYQEQDIDNIRIVTDTPANPLVGSSVGSAFGFRFSIVDQGALFPDTNTLTASLDGQAVTPTGVVRDVDPDTGATYTFVNYENTNVLLAPGSTHTNIIAFSGTGFSEVRKTNVFLVPNYTVLSNAQKAPGTVDTAQTGFAGRFNQLNVARLPDLVTIERQITGMLIDPDLQEPISFLTGPTDAPLDVVNLTDNAGNNGNFSTLQQAPLNVADAGVPGVDPVAHDNIAGEIVTILDLPVGMYQLGVYHDDSFKLTAGAEPRDYFDATILATNGATRDDNNIFVVVTNAGKYPFRLLWGEGVGAGGQLEFYSVDSTTGRKVLVNQDVAGSIKAYRDLTALTQPYVAGVSPAPNERGVLNTVPVTVKLVNGSAATIVTNSISLKVNGQGTAVVSTNGSEITVTLATPAVTSGTANVSLSYNLSSGGTVTRTWSYFAHTFGEPVFLIPLNEGAGTNFTEQVLGLSGFFLTNNPFWSAGPSGAASDFAMRFDGQGGRRGTLPDPNRLITLGPDWIGSNGDYTLQAWVKMPTGFTPTVRMIIFIYEGLPGFALSINTGRTLHTTTFGLNDLNSTVVVPADDLWHHVAVVHNNGESMDFYLDGVLGQSVSYIRGPGQRANLAATVGAASNGANPFTGVIDRPIFTDGALAPEQFDFPLAPRLSVTRTGSDLTISWPASATGYKLQSTGDLLPGGATQWTDVTTAPVVGGGTASVTVPTTGNRAFYRLIKTP